MKEWQVEMLGAVENPRLEIGDLALKQLAVNLGKEDSFHPTNVAIYFGEPNTTVPDPYFNGDGPERSGCNYCGGCMGMDSFDGYYNTCRIKESS